jgi:hypothetical protein
MESQKRTIRQVASRQKRHLNNLPRAKSLFLCPYKHMANPTTKHARAHTFILFIMCREYVLPTASHFRAAARGDIHYAINTHHGGYKKAAQVGFARGCT